MPPAKDPSIHDGPPTRHEARAASGAEPAGQLTHCALPAAAYLPGRQGAQTPALVAPKLLEAEPAGHGVHTVKPSESAKEPAGHGEQLAALAPPGRERAVPTAQNWSQMVAPGVAVQEPAGQRRHDARDSTGE